MVEDIGGAVVKCYVCSSFSDPNCKDPFDSSKMQMTECTTENIKATWDLFYSAVQSIGSLTQIFNTLGIDLPQTNSKPDIPFACQKIDLEEKKATLRTCSFARTDHVDPCEDLKSKGNNNLLHVSFCGLCETDGCNGVGRLVIPWLLMILPALLVVA
uniref:Protein sleepless n=1 Tax=Timema douglasi TaxID=61478 RepID=A0A7R8VVZ3_TIMDO|nr:unnamed protein product [Timema douglasi]